MAKDNRGAGEIISRKLRNHLLTPREKKNHSAGLSRVVFFENEQE